jgi:YhcN/YlaJ family sporulation lipoprotein
MGIPKRDLVASLSLLFFLLNGCYNDAGKQYGKSPDHSNFGSPVEHTIDSERAYQTEQLYRPVTHNNKKLEFSQFLSNQVTALNGVNTAIVMLTEQNAYVAIQIDYTATGTKGGVRETNNTGTNRGLYNPHAPHTDAMDPTKLNIGVNNYETAQHHDQLSHRFKQHIAERIRYLEPRLLDVYISANRDFLNEMHQYARESRSGYSLMSYLTPFNQTVTKVFGTGQILPQQ